MRAALLGAALMSGVALLATAPAARAQNENTADAVPTGSERAAAPGSCGTYGTTPAVTGYGYRYVACTAASDPNVPPGCVGANRSALSGCGDSPGANRCDRRYLGGSGQPSVQGPPGTRYVSSQGSPFFAPGGEAYSYAGYGAFSPYGYGVGTNGPTGEGDTVASATVVGAQSSAATGSARVCS
jgi:hypothetical protein